MTQIRPYIFPALLLLLAGLAFSPALQLFVQKWQASDDYAHAFLIAPAIVYMIWQRRELLSDADGNPLIGLLLAAGSVAAYLFTLLLQIPTLIFLATIAFVVSMLIFYGGFSVLRPLALPIMLMLLVVPIPNQLLSSLTASLQLWISDVSEVIIRGLAIPLFREGNILHIEKMSFHVEEACSGIRSLISMTTMSLLIGYYLLSRVSSTVLLFLFSIPTAILINIIRVVGLVLVYHYFQLDLTTGLPHTLTGLVLFAIGLVVLFAGQRLLEKWETKKNTT